MSTDGATQPIIIWALIIVSIVLVAGITYIYTNRNARVTALLTVLAALVVAMIKLVGVVEIELNAHFIGGFDASHKVFIVAEPGWMQLIEGWHIWLIPVTVVVIIFSVLLYLTWTYRGEVKKTDVLLTATPLKTPYQQLTRAERLSSFMAMDAAKKEAQQVNEKLAEALLMNAAFEIKVSDLSMQVHELERELTSTKHDLQDEISTLQLELSAKQKENDYIAQQLTERSKELLRAQEMFEKLLALQQQDRG